MPHRTIPNLGHRFDWDLNCKWCHEPWMPHQGNPTTCQHTYLEPPVAPGNATHCGRGHPRTDEHGYAEPNSGKWQCQTCKSDRDKRNLRKDQEGKFCALDAEELGDREVAK